MPASTSHLTGPGYFSGIWTVHCPGVEGKLGARYLHGTGEYCLLGQGGGQHGLDQHIIHEATPDSGGGHVWSVMIIARLTVPAEGEDRLWVHL